MNKSQEIKEISFLFESGTSQYEIVKYSELLRAQLTGKVPDEQVEQFVSEFLSNAKNMKCLCDGCQKEITNEEKEELNNKFSFACKMCLLKYDLCTTCQKEGIVVCPEGFGCESSKYSNMEDSIFIPRQVIHIDDVD
jgi:hypothetical protein